MKDLLRWPMKWREIGDCNWGKQRKWRNEKTVCVSGVCVWPGHLNFLHVCTAPPGCVMEHHVKHISYLLSLCPASLELTPITRKIDFLGVL